MFLGKIKDTAKAINLFMTTQKDKNKRVCKIFYLFS